MFGTRGGLGTGGLLYLGKFGVDGGPVFSWVSDEGDKGRGRTHRLTVI